MSDQTVEAVSDGGSAAPQETSTPSAGAVASLPQESKDIALNTMAKSEDVTDFIEESRDRKQEESGEAPTPHKRANRSQRYKRTIERLKAERSGQSADVAPAEHGEQSQQVYSDESDQHGGMQREAHDRWERKAAEVRVRTDDYFKANPYAKADIETVFEIYPPAQHVASALMLADADMIPQIAYEMAQYPDAIEELNNLQPAEAARVIGAIESRLKSQKYYEAQQEAASRYDYDGRRMQTKAPAPLGQVKGGANPPARVADLAKGEDATALIKHWQKEKRRA